MKMSGIYKIQSKIKPERVYIGSSVNVRNRRHDHFRELRLGIHKNSRLQKHCNKYGLDDLVFSVLIGCDKQNLLAYEQFYIDALKPYFNISPTAGNTLGCKCSEETKRKISEANKGKCPSEEARRKMGASHRGSHRSEETRRKMSLAALGNKNAVGTIPSEETKEKIRKTKIGNKDGFRKGHIPWNKGIKKEA
jgi:group I intron endonuclease